MKKKIITLILLILVGMWIVASGDGWCRMRPGPGRDPWSPAMLSYSGGGNNPNNQHIIVDTQNSIFINTISISISESQSAFRRGDKVPNNFQQKQGKSGQVNK
jgi:hypothetical protein